MKHVDQFDDRIPVAVDIFLEHFTVLRQEASHFRVERSVSHDPAFGRNESVGFADLGDQGDLFSTCALLGLWELPTRIDPIDRCGLTAFIPSFALGSHDGYLRDPFARARKTQPRLPHANGQIVLGTRRSPRDFPGFAAGSTASKIDIELTGIGRVFVLLEQVLSLALVVVADIDNLPDALGREHPFDRFAGHEHTVFAADPSEQDDLATDGRDEFGGSQQEFAASGPGSIGTARRTTFTELALMPRFPIGSSRHSVHAFFRFRGGLVRWTLNRIAVVGRVG